MSSENDDILKLITSLYLQKEHGPDDMSIHIIKIWDSALAKLLLLIFQNCFPITECSKYCSWNSKQITIIADLFYYSLYLKIFQTKWFMQNSTAVFCPWLIDSFRYWSFLLKVELCFYISKKLLKKYGMRITL